MSATERISPSAPASVDASAYVYGVTRRRSATPAGEGVGGARVVAVEHRKLAALTSSIPSAPVRAKRRDLLRHTEVLQQAFAIDTVVPLRFGTVFADEAAVVASFLEPRHDELEGLLRSFTGLVELTVRAFYREEEILAEIVRDDRRVAGLRAAQGRRGGQRADMALGEAVAAALAAKRAADADAIVHRLLPLSRDASIDEPRTEYEVIRAAFLVDRAAIATFDAAMDECARARSACVTFKYVGPLPPHSFVRLGAR